MSNFSSFEDEDRRGVSITPGQNSCHSQMSTSIIVLIKQCSQICLYLWTGLAIIKLKKTFKLKLKNRPEIKYWAVFRLNLAAVSKNEECTVPANRKTLIRRYGIAIPGLTSFSNDNKITSFYFFFFNDLLVNEEHSKPIAKVLTLSIPGF